MVGLAPTGFRDNVGGPMAIGMQLTSIFRVRAAEGSTEQRGQQVGVRDPTERVYNEENHVHIQGDGSWGKEGIQQRGCNEKKSLFKLKAFDIRKQRTTRYDLESAGVSSEHQGTAEGQQLVSIKEQWVRTVV